MFVFIESGRYWASLLSFSKRQTQCSSAHSRRTNDYCTSNWSHTSITYRFIRWLQKDQRVSHHSIKSNETCSNYFWFCRCVICMVEFMVDDKIKYLPCMHTYHQECIDDWLMRSLTCPSCLEPVDAALLNNYES